MNNNMKNNSTLRPWVKATLTAIAIGAAITALPVAVMLVTGHAAEAVYYAKQGACWTGVLSVCMAIATYIMEVK